MIISLNVLKTNKKIPKDTLPFLKKGIEKALKEYKKGIEYEKSGLDSFALKYIIKGIP